MRRVVVVVLVVLAGCAGGGGSRSTTPDTGGAHPPQPGQCGSAVAAELALFAYDERINRETTESEFRAAVASAAELANESVHDIEPDLEGRRRAVSRAINQLRVEVIEGFRVGRERQEFADAIYEAYVVLPECPGREGHAEFEWTGHRE